MALIKFGMMMTDARGKLGGQVFTRTRSGATVRTKVTPTNPRTEAQQLARSILGTVSSAWRGLSEEDRTSWNSAVGNYEKKNVFGDRYLPSGKNLFTSLNSNLLNVGENVIDTAPNPIEVRPRVLTSAVIDFTGKLITLRSLSPAPGAEFMVVTQATKPFSAGRYNFSGAYATIDVAIGTTFKSAADLYTSYVTKYGEPPVGSKVGIRTFIIAINTGQKSVISDVAGSVIE